MKLLQLANFYVWLELSSFSSDGFGLENNTRKLSQVRVRRRKDSMRSKPRIKDVFWSLNSFDVWYPAVILPLVLSRHLHLYSRPFSLLLFSSASPSDLFLWRVKNTDPISRSPKRNLAVAFVPVFMAFRVLKCAMDEAVVSSEAKSPRGDVANWA